jgi:hypothetical protein
VAPSSSRNRLSDEKFIIKSKINYRTVRDRRRTLAANRVKLVIDDVTSGPRRSHADRSFFVNNSKMVANVETFDTALALNLSI